MKTDATHTRTHTLRVRERAWRRERGRGRERESTWTEDTERDSPRETPRQREEIDSRGWGTVGHCKEIRSSSEYSYCLTTRPRHLALTGVARMLAPWRPLPCLPPLVPLLPVPPLRSEWRTKLSQLPSGSTRGGIWKHSRQCSRPTTSTTLIIYRWEMGRGPWICDG